eukprot:m.22788 g.22788  ORF g.22788 m.22788 type:complete len:308 (+) comp6953_c0_seq1:595-1518(+)
MLSVKFTGLLWCQSQPSLLEHGEAGLASVCQDVGSIAVPHGIGLHQEQRRFKHSHDSKLWAALAFNRAHSNVQKRSKVHRGKERERLMLRLSWALEPYRRAAMLSNGNTGSRGNASPFFSFSAFAFLCHFDKMAARVLSWAGAAGRWRQESARSVLTLMSASRGRCITSTTQHPKQLHRRGQQQPQPQLQQPQPQQQDVPFAELLSRSQLARNSAGERWARSSLGSASARATSARRVIGDVIDVQPAVVVVDIGTKFPAVVPRTQLKHQRVGDTVELLVRQTEATDHFLGDSRRTSLLTPEVVKVYR